MERCSDAVERSADRAERFFVALERHFETVERVPKANRRDVGGSGRGIEVEALAAYYGRSEGVEWKRNQFPGPLGTGKG